MAKKIAPKRTSSRAEASFRHTPWIPPERKLDVLGIALVGLVSLSMTAHAFTLAKDGKTSCAIVVANDAIEPEKTAARELQESLRQVTGADFAIRSETKVSADAPQILVGQSARLKQLAPNGVELPGGRDHIPATAFDPLEQPVKAPVATFTGP